MKSEFDLIESTISFYQNPFLSLQFLQSHSTNVPRSLLWKHSFTLLPTHTELSFQQLDSVLSSSRLEYDRYRAQYLRAPDGVDGINVKETTQSDHQINNPLSQEVGNVWISWFEDLELRKTIRQDVERCYPEIEYFSRSDVQDRLTDLLFIYQKVNPFAGGYRQGQHELLAPFLLVVELDSIAAHGKGEEGDTVKLARLVLNRDYVEHDTFALFSALMKSARLYYDSTTSIPTHTSPHPATSAPKLVQPIIILALRVQNVLLKTIDYELYSALTTLQMEPQLYMIKWLRLLFSREFSLDETLSLWDRLFAEDATSLKLVEYIVIAMLLRIRDALIDSDYNNAIQLLFRYPLPTHSDHHQVEMLVKQAIYLRDNVSASAGEKCRAENEALGLTAGEGNQPRMRITPSPSLPALPQSNGAYSTSSITAALLAEGGAIAGELARRAEALGVNKALSDIKRNVHQSIESEFPARSFARDANSELNRLRSENLKMGHAIELCIAELEVRWSSNQSAEGVVDAQGLNALTALRHVREVLGGTTATFDSNVLQPLSSPSVSSPIAPISPLPPSTPVLIEPPLSPPKPPPPPPKTASSGSPPLLLGSRNDRPATSLSRTPIRMPVPTNRNHLPATGLSRPPVTDPLRPRSTNSQPPSSSTPVSILLPPTQRETKTDDPLGVNR